MAYSRFALASVEVPAVDQIRVSDDYAVDLQHMRTFSVNAYIGTSSMLAAALGLAPYKDVFWSSSDQPGCVELNTAVCAVFFTVCYTLCMRVCVGGCACAWICCWLGCIVCLLVY